MAKNLYIFGCSGIGKSICDTLHRMSAIYDEIVFVDNDHHKFNNIFYGCRVRSYDDLAEMQFEENHAIFAFFKPKDIFDREVLIDKILGKYNLQLTSIVDPTSVVSRTSNIGLGTYIGPNVIVDSDARIGENCIILFNSVISREVSITSNSFISAGCVLKGSISINKSSFISANVSLATNIHEKSFVNAGVVLTEEIVESSIIGMERTLKKMRLPEDKKSAQKRLRFLHP